MNNIDALFFASFGNLLAISLNYFFGYYFFYKAKSKLKNTTIGKKSLYFGYKYKYLFLWLSWLPVVGDPITIVAGLLRVKFYYFILIAGSLRILRYIFILFLVDLNG